MRGVIHDGADGATYGRSWPCPVSHLGPTHLGLDVHKDTISMAILALIVTARVRAKPAPAIVPPLCKDRVALGAWRCCELRWQSCPPRAPVVAIVAVIVTAAVGALAWSPRPGAWTRGRSMR
jgi:hypothetical protein